VAQVGAVIGRGFSYGLLRAVAGIDNAPLQTALEKLADADIVLVQGLPPHSDYRFKHALIQDAAYENLLKSRRQSLHRRLAETLRDHFADTAEAEPEVLAHHFTQAGMTEAAIEWWGKAGQRSMQRSALVEAIEQITRALSQVATLPPTAALRHERIKIQVALIPALINVKGYAAPETRAAAEYARLLIQQARAIGEPPEDPLLSFQVLYSFWVANFANFNGDMARDLAAEFFALAEQDGTAALLMTGHRLMARDLAAEFFALAEQDGTAALLMTGHRLLALSSLCTGEITQSRAHLNQAIALYDPLEHPSLATKFGVDGLVAILFGRSHALWMLGYPDGALADAEHAIQYARKIGQAATLRYALNTISHLHLYRRNYPVVLAQCDELIALADKSEAVPLKQSGTSLRFVVLELIEKTNKFEVIASAMAADQVTLFRPFCCRSWPEPILNSVNSKLRGAALNNR
jgi:hypothetical protein